MLETFLIFTAHLLVNLGPYLLNVASLDTVHLAWKNSAVLSNSHACVHVLTLFFCRVCFKDCHRLTLSDSFLALVG